MTDAEPDGLYVCTTEPEDVTDTLGLPEALSSPLRTVPEAVTDTSALPLGFNICDAEPELVGCGTSVAPLAVDAPSVTVPDAVIVGTAGVDATPVKLLQIAELVSVGSDGVPEAVSGVVPVFVTVPELVTLGTAGVPLASVPPVTVTEIQPVFVSVPPRLRFSTPRFRGPYGAPAGSENEIDVALNAVTVISVAPDKV